VLFKLAQPIVFGRTRVWHRWARSATGLRQATASIVPEVDGAAVVYESEGECENAVRLGLLAQFPIDWPGSRFTIRSFLLQSSTGSGLRWQPLLVRQRWIRRNEIDLTKDQVGMRLDLTWLHRYRSKYRAPRGNSPSAPRERGDC
jgi:hypothetical protein